MSKKLWEPSREKINQSNMIDYMNYINRRFNKDFKEYSELYNWSVDNIADFWASIWDYMDIVHSKTYDQVVDGPNKMPGAKWFIGAELN